MDANLFYPKRKCVIDGSFKTYLMKDSTTGYFKIGKSKKPSYREETLMSQKPEISIHAVCDSDVEKRLHRMYKHQRVRGEWFNLSETDIYDIINTFEFYIPDGFVCHGNKGNESPNKRDVTTIAVDTWMSLRLDDFCKKRGFTKKEFIAISLDFFDKYDIDPRQDIKPQLISSKIDEMKFEIDKQATLLDLIAKVFGEARDNIKLRNDLSDERWKILKDRLPIKESQKNKWWKG